MVASKMRAKIRKNVFTVYLRPVSFGFPPRSDTNPAVDQPQKMASGLKFWI